MHLTCTTKPVNDLKNSGFLITSHIKTMKGQGNGAPDFKAVFSNYTRDLFLKLLSDKQPNLTMYVKD